MSLLYIETSCICIFICWIWTFHFSLSDRHCNFIHVSRNSQNILSSLRIPLFLYSIHYNYCIQRFLFPFANSQWANFKLGKLSFFKKFFNRNKMGAKDRKITQGQNNLVYSICWASVWLTKHVYYMYILVNVSS